MKPDLIATTRGICPRCRKLLPASVLSDQGKVFLERTCPEHGRHLGLISSDAGYYLQSLSYVKPGTLPLAFSTQVHAGCPADCGLCPEHEQHTCLPVIEITGRCDLECPVCLVGGTSPRNRRDLSLADFGGILATLSKTEGTLDLINLSGGEPTLHPQFREIVELCGRPEVLRTSVSTNGLRLSTDGAQLDWLQEKNVLISLQFDGFSPEVYPLLRGADILAAKQKLLRRLEERRMAHSLVVTLEKDVNEKEIAGILDYFFGHDQALSLMFQPLARTGRCREKERNPLERITIPDVIRLIADASRGRLVPGDFSPLPCSHPACFALTYLLKLDGGDFIPVPRLVPVEPYLDIIQNRSLPGLESGSFAKIQDCLYRLWSSAGAVPDSERILATVKKLVRDICCQGSDFSPRQALAIGEQRIKSIFIHHFMDEDNYDLARAVRCCNHYPQADGRLLPACTHNIFTRSGMDRLRF